MKYNKLSKLLVALSIAFAGNLAAVSAQEKFSYDEYKPRTVAEIVGINSDLKSADVVFGKKDAPQMVLYADFLRSQARVKFMNKSRPISPDRKELLKFWQKTYAIEDGVFNLYENEYLFKECDGEYWLPVQKQVAAFFPKELKEGDMVSLFIIRGGGRKVGNNWDWVFLVNEFQK